MAESDEGREIYVLHDNGRKLFTSSRDCTPIQRFLYVMARAHHEEDPNEMEEPANYGKAQQFQNASSKF